MAGAVAGGGALLSASLKVLLNRMDSPEVRTFLRGQKLSATLRRELKMKLLAVKAVLNDAEAKQITNSDVKDWMDELKDAVYDAEDLVDDITTEALRCKMESDSQSQELSIAEAWVPILTKGRSASYSSYSTHCGGQPSSVMKSVPMLNLSRICL